MRLRTASNPLLGKVREALVSSPLGWLRVNDAPDIGGAERLGAFGINGVRRKRSRSIEPDPVSFHQHQLTAVYL
jgi:hypothetical protein